MNSVINDVFCAIWYISTNTLADDEIERRHFFQLYNEDPLTEFHCNRKLYRKSKAFGLFEYYSFDKPVEESGIFKKQMEKSEKV